MSGGRAPRGRAGRPRRLRFDPVPALRSGEDPALDWFVRRDLLAEEVGDVACAVWSLPEVERLFRRQRADGGVPPRGGGEAALVDTWKLLSLAVGKYELDRRHPGLARAAEHAFRCQTAEGDLRGILGNQVAMYYTGALLGLLIRAGYGDDPRVARGLAWLLDARQDDGGWVANRLMTARRSRAEMARLCAPGAATVVEHDRAAPSSHHFTGMVLRGFAAHPAWRDRPEIRAAARRLAAGFFRRDAHSSYQAADHWLRFQFPYWWNHLVAALDCLTDLGFSADHPDLARGVDWLIEHQQPSGLWRASYSRIHRSDPDSPRGLAERRWITLAICRVLARQGVRVTAARPTGRVRP